MLISEITLGQSYFTCCFINGKKDVARGEAKGKFEYVDGSAFVDLLLDEESGFGNQIVRPNITDIFSSAAEAIDALEAYLVSTLSVNQETIDALKAKYEVEEPEED